MKNTLPLLMFLAVMISCGGSNQSEATEEKSDQPPGKTEVSEEQQSDPLKNKGIGPITEVTLGDIDQEMADRGKKVYNSMCSACHQVEQDYIGPSPKGILERRSPEWVMNMILNPAEMLQKDPIAIKLLEEANGVPMTYMGTSEQEAREILEYFRTL